MDEDVGETDKCGRRVDPNQPAAMAQIEKHARYRHHDDEGVDEPVQPDIEGFELHPALRRHQQHAQLLQRVARGQASAEHIDEVGRRAEEQRQPGHEMPGPNLTLRKDRRQPVRNRSQISVASDADAGEQAHDECDGCRPMQHDGADVGSRWLGAAVAAGRCVCTGCRGSGPSRAWRIKVSVYDIGQGRSPLWSRL